MKFISTVELVKRVKANKGKVFEVAILKGFFRATHFIYFGGRLLYDTGIDSQEIKWKPEEFVSYYSSTFWHIDQVV
jgi:hypothetical protein